MTVQLANVVHHKEGSDQAVLRCLESPVTPMRILVLYNKVGRDRGNSNLLVNRAEEFWGFLSSKGSRTESPSVGCDAKILFSCCRLFSMPISGHIFAIILLQFVLLAW